MALLLGLPSFSILHGPKQMPKKSGGKPLKADMIYYLLQGEQFELTPATPLLSQAVVLGDRRTYSVYDLTQQATFGSMRSLNMLLRLKSTEGECECGQRWPKG